MTLDDERIERYSRQLILQEVGPRGQERLGAARVAIVGTGLAAAHVVAYLAAAGVGWIAADPALHATVDPAQPDLTIAPLAAADDAALDGALVAGESVAAVGAALATWQTRAAITCWIAAGRAGMSPPCPHCAAAATAVVEPPPELADRPRRRPRHGRRDRDPEGAARDRHPAPRSGDRLRSDDCDRHEHRRRGSPRMRVRRGDAPDLATALLIGRPG